jgi:hypothetical protein
MRGLVGILELEGHKTRAVQKWGGGGCENESVGRKYSGFIFVIFGKIMAGEGACLFPFPWGWVHSCFQHWL